MVKNAHNKKATVFSRWRGKRVLGYNAGESPNLFKCSLTRA